MKRHDWKRASAHGNEGILSLPSLNIPFGTCVCTFLELHMNPSRVDSNPSKETSPHGKKKESHPDVVRNAPKHVVSAYSRPSNLFHAFFLPFLEAFRSPRRILVPSCSRRRRACHPSSGSVTSREVRRCRPTLLGFRRRATGPRSDTMHRVRTDGSSRNVSCRAVPRRVERVSRQLERELGELLRSDKVLRRAVCPNEAMGQDLALSAMASVTQVELTRDMQVARVYLSLFSDEKGKMKAMENLGKLQGYARKEVGKRMRLRLVPEIRFIFDDTYERSSRVLGLLDRIEQARDGGVMLPPPPIALGPEEEEEDLV